MARKRAFYTLDCETDPFKRGRVPQPFIWGLYDGSEYQTFDTPQEVAQYLSRIKGVVYAHNGGKFDYHYLRQWINTDENILIISGRLAKFRIGECEFRDSYNILPVPLSAFKKDEIDYSIFEPEARNDPNNRAAIERYLRADCVYLYDFLTQYFDKYGRGLTQAGASMAQWLQEFYKVPLQRQTATQHNLYKKFYYGGRVQCFRTGYSEEKFDVVDINSAYPYAMKAQHPISTSGTIMRTLPKEGEFNRVLVSLECVSHGGLPWRDEYGSLYFPDDERTPRLYHVTGPELQTALETNTIKTSSIIVNEVHYFSEMVTFDDYVEKFFAIRLKAKAEGNKTEDLFAKLRMNSLYGKFGANPATYDETVIATDDTKHKWESIGYLEDTAFNGHDGRRYLMTVKLAEDKQKFFNVCTAASITGFVRAHLWKSLLKCSDPIYCDTDSIAARDTSGLDLGDKLGQWKHEMTGDRFAVAGKKLYTFHEPDGKNKEFALDTDERGTGNWKRACKGVSLTPQQIIDIAQGKTVNHVPLVPTYSVHRPEPQFTNRRIKLTHKQGLSDRN